MDIERKIEKELRKITKNKKAFWLEWRLTEQEIKNNLREGEKILYLPLCKVWVAYKDKK